MINYSQISGQHYWYVRDRMGSTVAVVNANGNGLLKHGGCQLFRG